MSIEKIFDEDVNLNKYISNERNPEELRDLEYAIGDLHANAWLMFWFLGKEGISSCSEATAKIIQSSYHTSLVDGYYRLDIDSAKNAVDSYKAALQEVTFNSVKKIHFIGDTLADRSRYGDQYILFNYEALSRNHISFDICLSNHDLEFITAYWRAKKGRAEDVGETSFLSIAESTINADDQVESAVVLNRLVGEKVLKAEDISPLIEEHYLPKVNLFSYTITADGLVLMTHAPVDFGLIECAAKALDVYYRDDTPQALARTIDAINDRFNKLYIQTGDIVGLGPTKENNTGYEEGGIQHYRSINSQRIAQVSDDPNTRMRYILAALTWNRPLTQGELQRPATHRGYSICYVNGHTRTGNDPEHIANLDSLYGRDEDSYIPQVQYKYKESGYNIGYRTTVARSLSVPADTLETQLENITEICEKLAARYQEKIQGCTAEESDKLKHYQAKNNFIVQMLHIAENAEVADPNLKIREICKIYNQNQDKLEAENDPTNKGLIKALKVILIGVGVLVFILPGLIALGVFANRSEGKTGSMNFLSDEANKTSTAMELKAILRKV